MTDLPADLRAWPDEARTDLTERAGIMAEGWHDDAAAKLTPGERDRVIADVRRAWPSWGGRR